MELLEKYDKNDNVAAVYWRKTDGKSKIKKSQKLELAEMIDIENRWGTIDIDALVSNCYANCRKVIGLKETKVEK
jgi:hypothetical protein